MHLYLHGEMVEQTLLFAALNTRLFKVANSHRCQTNLPIILQVLITTLEISIQ